jgi:hypothetical protein
MRQLFERLIREGHLRAADPDVLMLAFTGPMFVWRQLNAIGADHSVLRAPAAFAKAHVDQFLQGAAAGRTAAVHRPASPRRTVATRGATRRGRVVSADSARKSER